MLDTGRTIVTPITKETLEAAGYTYHGNGLWYHEELGYEVYVYTWGNYVTAEVTTIEQIQDVCRSPKSPAAL